ncbi:unnamed protein product [Thlaspi arvense]|uniref:LisH domain-containing protein n=1 Tax=Thlaspi arvense TaxID=13288 RepID=A0AAU9SFQ5_THLAR|nr:unnamed protein product [Thlaspi arvense]
MGKSSKSKGSANIGNGEITPTQIAFIVDRYLCDNRFSKTRSLFRTEASSLLSNSPVRDVLKSYLTLEDILKDYVSLREQKVALDQERVILDQEKIRVQNLLQGMQNVMNTYNASLTAPPPPPPPPPVPAPTSQQKNYRDPSSGCAQYNAPNVMSVSLLGNKRVDFGNFSTQSITGKRKGPEVSVEAPPVTRRARITTAQDDSTANETNKIPQADKAANNSTSQTVTLAKKSSSGDELMTGPESSVVKCLFNKADSSLPTSSICLRTPQKHASSPGSDKHNSLHKEVTPTNCTIVTKERFTISPLKQITSYTVERSRHISSSSSKRDHVKGRLNFDDCDTETCLEAPATADMASTSSSGSDQEVDLTDIDFSILSEDFSFSELLVDLDLGCEGSTPNAPMETVSSQELQVE